MNILHHKSWHVRNKDNIARVGRDEAKAAEEERKKEEQVKRAEQEIRINYLRSKVKSDGSNNESTFQSTKDDLSVYESRNIIHKSNKDHEKEKKDEQEKYEKQIGLLTYLGKSKDNTVSDAHLKSWYDLPPKRSKSDKIDSSKAEDINSKDEKLKDYYDPLKYYFRDKDKKKKVEIKTKKKTEKKSDFGDKKNLSEKDKLKILREERLKREIKEKERQNALLLGKK